MAIHKKITSDKAPKAIGFYSPALSVDNMVYLSGMLGINPASGKIEEESAAGQARQALNNIKALLEAAGLTFANIVRVTIYLTDITDFAAVNTVYGEFVGDPYPVRSCFAVSALPMNGKVEIEVTCSK